MIPEACKRLAEVDFPISVVSRHAAVEKSIRLGHPRTLHMWWARRPLASSRAMLLGLLLPDPCDPLCAPEFKDEARRLLPRVGGCDPGTTDDDLRRALLKFVGNFADWAVAANGTYLEVSRGLVKAAYGDEELLVVDPFAGGGSIPLEALRLGCGTLGSDLNPVACLILKATLEHIPRRGPTLVEDLRRRAVEIKQHVELALAPVYPKDPDGSVPMAYVWARTVRCEAPGCGAEIPLLRSFWLCNKAGEARALHYRVLRVGREPRVEFQIFKPTKAESVAPPTVTGARATCIACGATLSPDRLRKQLSAQSGGSNVVFDSNGKRSGGALLLAVVGPPTWDLKARRYRLPTSADYDAVRLAQQMAGHMEPGRVPDESIIQDKVSRNSPFRMHLYGHRTFGDLFNARQTVALVAVQTALQMVARTEAEKILFTLSMGKAIRHWNAFAKWHRGSETVAGSFALQAISMSWDYPELSPFASYAGGLDDIFTDVIEAAGAIGKAAGSVGQAELLDACEQALPDGSVACWFTDPPYYDAIPYADISDVFYTWHKRTLPDNPVLANVYDPTSRLTPKDRELIQDDNRRVDGRPKDAAFFEEGIGKAFSIGRRQLSDGGVGCVVFAHKTTEGWEALLSGLVAAGWTVTSSWPIATERSARLRARESAALATSVHLVCRPRGDHAGVGDWGAVLSELPARVGDWMERLQKEGIRGADLVFACIGPALEIYSRYAKVETADGRQVPLAEYLEKVWEVVGRSALGQVLGTSEATARNGAAGAIEEDARLTALFLWTLQSTKGTIDQAVSDRGNTDELQDDDEEDEEASSSRGKAKGYTLVFDVVRRFAQPLGIELPKWEGRVIETRKGVVRLLPVMERAKQLFGEEGAQAAAERIERETSSGTSPLQGMLFPDSTEPAIHRRRGRGRAGEIAVAGPDQDLNREREATTLDRVHVAMLLQAGGRTNALRALIKTEQDRSPDFLRLANALSALYPKGSEEKRLLDAMLLAVPR